MKLTRILTYIAVFIMIMWVIFPIYWILNLSLQTEDEIFSVPPHYLPPSISLHNYIGAFNIESVIAAQLERGGSALFLFIPGAAKDFPRALINSTVVALIVMAFNLVAGTLAAFVFSRVRFKGDMILFFSAIAGRLLPPIVIAVPFYVIIRGIGLLDNLISVIIVHITFSIPLVIWILTTYAATIPEELDEAARIDGYTHFEIMRRIFIPLIKPALVVIGIMSFVSSYTEFFFGLLLTKSAASRTLPVVIGESLSVPVAVRGLPAAMGIIVAIAPIIIVIIFRRYLIRGLVAGAVK